MVYDILMTFRKHVLVILRGERSDYEQMYMLEYTCPQVAKSKLHVKISLHILQSGMAISSTW